MAVHHSPMLSVVSLEANPSAEPGSSTFTPHRRSGSSSSALTPPGPRHGHPQTLPLSPPFSPPRNTEELKFKPSPPADLHHSGRPHMLSVSSSASEAAKLDVSSLLKYEASPRPSSSDADSKRGGHSRSSSVPLPAAQYLGGGPIHRTSVSESSVVLIPSRLFGSSKLTAQPSLPAQAADSHFSSAYRPTLPAIQHPHPHQPGHHTQPPPPPPPQQQQQPQQPAESAYHAHSSPYQPGQRRLSPTNPPSKRSAPGPHPAASPAKRQSKWTPEEDALIIELRGSGMKWEEISKRLPGRSAISCRLHYQNYLERRSEWDEERKNRLARLYERLKPEMWGPLAAELGIPWRAAEAMHWQLGEVDMARRAGVVPFSLATSTATVSSGPPSAVAAPGPSPLTASPYGPNAPSALHLHGVARGAPVPRRPEETPYPPVSALSGPPPPPPPHAPRPVIGAPPHPGPGMLPSLAELDRGRSAYDERARAGEHPGWYPPPPQNRGYPDYRR